MTTTITPEQADILPAEAIEAAAEALYTADYRNGEPFAKYPVGSHWGDRYRSEASAALLAALPHLARRADDHYFAVDYTGCIHEAPDRETAIKWAEDFARTANGGAIGSERPEVAAAIGSLARRAAVPSEQEPVAWRATVNPYGQPGFEYAEAEQALIDKGRHERQPLFAHPAPAAGVRVEALEWVRSSWARPNNDGTLSRAESVFGTYRVWTNPETGKWFWRLSGTADNELAAKAAAQADYEARIRSALE